MPIVHPGDNIFEPAFRQGAADPNSPGIRVIIVGLGVAGLTTAIESHRRGLHVIGVEKKPKASQDGDMISISGNALRVIEQWGNGSVASAFKEIRSNLASIDTFNDAGELQTQMPFNPDSPYEGFFVPRSALLELLYQHAKSLGLDLRFGMEVTDYWETDTEAGVTIGGERIHGDCLICADGMHSKTREIITGDVPDMIETGCAAFRSHFNISEIADDPDVRWLLQATSDQDIAHVYFARGVHIILGTTGNGRVVFWTCPHSDVNGASEAWTRFSSVDHALNHIHNWPIGKKLRAIISKTPGGKCLNHLLVAQKPLRTWVSQRGRMILIGDAAHPMLPTAGQGANQAIEDAAVLAICLELSGKENVPLGLAIMEKLRYKRVTIIQQGAYEMLKVQMRGEWESREAEDKPNVIARPGWIYCHDCVEHTYKEFDMARDSILRGTEYIPTNAPADGKFDRTEDFVKEGGATV